MKRICAIFLLLSSIEAISAPAQKDEWLNMIEAVLPAAFCKKDSPFMKCYEISQTTCIDIALNSVKDCVDKHKASIPEFLERPESKSWGSIIGACAGDKLSDVIEAKRMNTKECTPNESTP